MLTDRSDSLLEVRNISKIYGRSIEVNRKRLVGDIARGLIGKNNDKSINLANDEFWSLQDISFTLVKGEALGVIGLNGAGKTTLLRLLSGQILPDKGEIITVGNSVSMIDITAGFQMNLSGRRNVFLKGIMIRTYSLKLV